MAKAMLKLENIVKDYKVADTVVHALKGVSLSFRKNEFVSVLGHSGCGKTTLLNIIGGLDHYTSGDLVIRGTSTKNYNDKDWDAYRNHSIGFVFQSYNLIPHQTVLGNVELALTLSGISAAERKERARQRSCAWGSKNISIKSPTNFRAADARVAIARALVNDPEILLARRTDRRARFGYQAMQSWISSRRSRGGTAGHHGHCTTPNSPSNIPRVSCASRTA